MPHLLVITPYPNLSADTRYRIMQFIPGLEKAGWRVSLRPFMDARLFTIYNQPGNTVQKIRWTISGLVDRVGSIVSANQYDAILIHKEAFPFGPPWLENALQKRVSCLIFDMDDAFWTHPPQFHQIGSRFRDPNRIAKMIGMSDHVLAGNEFLANYATNYNSAVTIFPTVLDTDRIRALV